MRKVAVIGAGLSLIALAPSADTAWAQTGSVTQAVSEQAGSAQVTLAGSTAATGGAQHAGYGVRAVCRSAGEALKTSVPFGCRALQLTKSVVSTAPATSYVPGGYGPAALATAYALPTNDVGSGTIGILDAGSYPALEKDLAVYRSQFKLPPCTTKNGCLRIVGQDGGAPPAPATSSIGKDFDSSASFETSLDVDVASAACPACKILVVETNRPNFKATNYDSFAAMFATAANTAVRLGAKAVSISWGFPATPYLMSGSRAAAFDHPGVPITVSSGDSGYMVDYNDWPQSLPGVITVGGTSLFPAHTARGYAETAWIGSGSGCGPLAPNGSQPAWVVAPCGGNRAVSDISADADPYTGYATYDSFGAVTPLDGWSMGGGTSASSPLIAALFVRAGGANTGSGPSGLYAAPKSAFFDVTVGANAYPPDFCAYQIVCVARDGWDGPTGRGTPNGLAAFR